MTTLRMINRIGKRQRRPVAVEKVKDSTLWGLYFIGDNNKMPYVYFSSLDKAWSFIKNRCPIQFGMMR
jgi:hypothetical protein